MHAALTALSLLHFFELENLDFDDGDCCHYLVAVQSGRHLPPFRKNRADHQNGDFSSKMSVNAYQTARCLL